MMMDPFDALAARPGGALALLIDARGGFPRKPGAAMALWPDGGRVGRLGAGCIDADIATYLEAGQPVIHLTYGQGGPVDLPLPCGGSVRIALIRRPDADFLAQVAQARRDRRPRSWHVDLTTGAVRADDPRDPGLYPDGFVLQLTPPPALHVHGEGDEATALAALCRGLLLPLHLGSDQPRPDPYSAVVTLFHDHDRELPALIAGLNSPAFYVGALGSRRAQLARQSALSQAGVDARDLVRLRGPIGVIAPVRDPRLLASSVLTEVLDAYEKAFG